MDHYENHYETDEESEPEVEVEVEKPKKRGKKRKDPNKPKKFMTAYILYSNNVRSSVSTANPEAKFGDIARLISKQFKSLDDDERAKWDELARLDKERYRSEMENYEPPSDDDGDEGGSRKKKKDPNAPKRNMSAFFIYSNDVRPAVRAENPGIKFGDVARLISSKFKALSTDERAKYDELAVADKERYQAQMAQYKETGTFD